MKAIRVRKNFLFDRSLVEKVQERLKEKNKTLTEAITLYFKALEKDPTILDEVEEISKRREGNFVGMLDGMIGDKDFKELKHEAYVEDR